MKKRRFRVNAAVWFLLPYLLMFVTFIVIPVLAAMVLSFTNYDAVQTPKPAGFLNYINLLTQDEIFMQYVLPNTCVFAFIVGPVGYMLSFLLAWMLAQISKGPRTILALLIYSPSMTSGVAMAVVWKIIFAGDQMGYVNSLLMNLGITNQPILFTSDARFLLPIMIVVSLWSSMGVGFLAILAGILNINPEYYEAAAIDGATWRQRVWHITLPGMLPIILLMAAMSLTSILSAGFDQIYNLYSPMVYKTGDVLDTYVYRMGLIGRQYSFSTAVGLLRSVVGLILMVTANELSKRFTERKIF